MKARRKRRTIREHGPNAIDVHVGGRIRQRRTELGLSQTKLADALDLTFQQVQKYETGANRVGASRLYDISHVLRVPVEHFFDGLTKSEPESKDVPMNRNTVELVRAYYKVTNPRVRKQLFETAKALSHT